MMMALCIAAHRSRCDVRWRWSGRRCLGAGTARRPRMHPDRPLDRPRGDHRRLLRRRPHHLRLARECRSAGRRQGRYDVIVVLEGPARPVVVRRKDRVLGMWINTEVRDLRQRAGLLFGRDDAHAAGHHRSRTATGSCRSAPTTSICEPLDRDGRPGDARGIHRRAARPQEGDRPLQRAHRRRAVPVAEPVPRHADAGAERAGRHAQGARLPVQATACSSRRTRRQLAIVKSGFEQSIFRFAHDHSLFYGILRRRGWPCSPAGSDASSSAGIEAEADQPGLSIDAGNGEDAARRRSYRPSARRAGTARHRRGRAR